MKILLVISASLLFIIGHMLRTIRWRITIGNDYSFSELFKRLSLSYLIDMFAPLRFGQVIRIIPIKASEYNKTKLFCSLLYEKTLDVISVGIVFILFPITDRTIFTDLSSIWTWIIPLFTIVLVCLYTENGLRVLLKISSFGRFEYLWTKILYENQQIFRRVQSARIKYILFTFIMWISYILAVYLFSASLQLEFSSALIGLYGNFIEPPAYFIAKSATLNAALGYVSMMAIPLLMIVSAGNLSNKKSYAYLRKSEKKLSGSIPLPTVLFSPAELRDYMLNLQSRKNFLIEELSRSYEYRINFLRDLGGGSGAATFIVDHSDSGDLSVIKMSNEEFLVQRLNAQFKHMKIMDEEKVPVIKVEKVFSESRNFFAYEMPFSHRTAQFHDLINELPINNTIEILSDMMLTLNRTLYRFDKESTPIYKNRLIDYYTKKIDLIFEELDQYLFAITPNDKININGKVHMALNKTRFKAWLSQFSATGNGCWGVHGDLTFQNMLVDLDSKNIILIDSNPNHDIKHPSVDLGKILQSLRLRYELFENQQQRIHVSQGEISYELPTSDVYQELESRIDEWMYTEYLNTNFSNIKIQTHAQYGIHLLRLLPYKLRYKPSEFPIFYAELTRHINLAV